MNREVYCPIKAGNVDELVGKSCPCGWPEKPCIVYYKELRTDPPSDPPEPGCVFDGETWRHA